MKKSDWGRFVIFLFLAVFLIFSWLFINSFFDNSVQFSPTISTSSVEKSFSFPDVSLEKNENGFIVNMGDLLLQGISGNPILPFKTVKFLIPSGEKVSSVSVIPSNKIILDGEYYITYAQEPKPFGDIPLSNYAPSEKDSFGNIDISNSYLNASVNATVPNKEVYDLNKNYPGVVYSIESSSEKYGYDILVINLYPVQYNPVSQKVSYYKKIDVKINFDKSLFSLFSADTKEKNTNLRNSDEDKNKVRDFVDNPEDLVSSNSLSLQGIAGETDESYDYVIITNSTLEPAFSILADWKNNTRGINTKIVLIEDILSNSSFFCDGVWGDGCTSKNNTFNDTQAKIRNFIKFAYNTWGIDYVLLGGDISVIPPRSFYVNTFGYFTNYDIPSDLYYAGLDGSWDTDKDSIFAEGSYSRARETSCNPPSWENGTAGDEADLLSEVFIGRAPVETLEETNNFVNKVIFYENSTLNNLFYLNKAVLVGERLDKLTYSSNSMENISDNLQQFERKTIYDDYLAMENRRGAESNTAPETGVRTIQAINAGASLILHDGHASGFEVSGLNHWSVSNLTNVVYPLFYSLGCYSASFDERTDKWWFANGTFGYGYPAPAGATWYSDGSSDSIAETLVLGKNGSFAYIGNSRYGWYRIDSQDGPGEVYMKSFVSILNSGENNLGKTLQKSKENLIGFANPNTGYTGRWIYYDLNLLGDPETQFMTTFSEPIVNFISPEFTSSLSGTINLTGTVQKGNDLGSSFSRYEVDYGYGVEPSVWMSEGISLVNPTSEKENAVLATFDTNYAKDNITTVRIRAYSAEELVSEDRLVLRTDNIKINQPFVWGDNVVYFNGTATSPLFVNYSLEYKKSNESSWILISSSTSNITNSSLGQLDFSSLVSGEYDLRLVVNGENDFRNEETISLILDPLFHTGWPFYSEHYFLAPSVGVGQLSSAPGKEIVAGEQEYGAESVNVYALYSNGTMMPNWPLNFSTYIGMAFTSAPLLVDVNNDGLDEIFINVGSETYGIYANGTTIPGWPQNGGGYKLVSLINATETHNSIGIVTISCGGTLFIFYPNGTAFSGWPKRIPDADKSAWLDGPAIGDVNGDGYDELVVASGLSQSIYVYDLSGNLLPGWPVNPKLCAMDIFPTLADLNKDGKLEILVGSGDGILSGASLNYSCTTGLVYAFNSDGTAVRGWPVNYSNYSSDLDYYGINPRGVSVANLDSDPYLEVVVEVGHGILIIDQNQSGISNLSLIARPLADYSSFPLLAGKKVIGYIDGDNQQEVLSATGEGNYPWYNSFTNKTENSNRLFAFKLDNSFASNWPRPTPKLNHGESSGRVKQSTPVLTDLDEDGKLDIILGDEHSIIVWNLNVPASASQASNSSGSEWPYMQANSLFTSSYEGQIECTASSQCNDNVACTVDSCINNRCVFNSSSCVVSPYCGDRVCNNGETCSSCVFDCGACPPISCSDGIQNQGETGIDCGGPCAACRSNSGGGGGSGSGGGGNIVSCTPSWDCSWTECGLDNLKKYNCADLNSCNTNLNKPSQDPVSCGLPVDVNNDDGTKNILGFELSGKLYTSLILLLAGIIVLIILLIVFLLMRKKNYY